MDEAVLKAIARWPDVPAVDGWLRLDRRGRWWVKNAATGAFESISNPAIVAFIGRNYAHDDLGRWFFQNGPQRVYVALEATPWIFRLDDARAALVAHTGAAAGRLRGLFLGDDGSLLADTELGPGLVLDRDLAAVLEQLHDALAGDDALPLADSRLEAVMRGEERPLVRFLGETVPLDRLDLHDIAARFGFVTAPRAG